MTTEATEATPAEKPKRVRKPKEPKADKGTERPGAKPKTARKDKQRDQLKQCITQRHLVSAYALKVESAKSTLKALQARQKEAQSDLDAMLDGSYTPGLFDGA
jgi:hypothetical protein